MSYKQVIKPNFFIVGAPRSGTTSLFAYLEKHPEVFIPAKKELYYFGRDLYRDSYVHTEDQYLALFSAATTEKLIGDVTPWYLYSQDAAREIKEFSPDAKIIMLLRNPIEMMQSLHSFNRNQLLWEDINNFAEALDLCEERKRGLNLPMMEHSMFKEPCYLYYKDVVRYTDQVARYFRYFGQENVMPIIFEEFEKDTARIYKQVCKFLNISTTYQPEFIVYHANRTYACETIHQLVSAPPKSVVKIGKMFIPAKVRKSLVSTVALINDRFNLTYTSTPMVDRDLSASLMKEYAQERISLGRLLNRDLSFWAY